MSETRTYYYARVSSGEQNLDRQIEIFKSMGAEEKNIFTDKKSGKNLDRENYRILRDTVLRKGDTLVVTSLDRLSRNKLDMKSELEYFKENGIRVKVVDMPTTMIDVDGQEWIIEMVNNIMIEVLSSIAEQERQTIRKRQAEGISAAKARGKQFGRPTAEFPKNWEEIYTRWKNKEIKANTAINLLKLKKTTFYKLAKIYEQGRFKKIDN